MKNIIIKIAAAATLSLGLFAASPALAGKGGSAGLIRTAIHSGSVDAITAELERAESLMCEECVGLVTNLLEDNRYEVREVAAWWFAKRPGLKDMLAEQFTEELATGGTIKARNAADFLGRTKTYKSLPTLRAAISRDVGAEAKVAMVRAVKYMAHKDGSPVLVTAMSDASPVVRAAAVNAWRDIRGQKSAVIVVGLLADTDATVRAEAATVVGAMGEASARTQLEAIVVSDPDAMARRNAAWALGKLGSAASRDALTKATADKSGLVRMVARASLASLK
jgi:HEAT repeat protein